MAADVMAPGGAVAEAAAPSVGRGFSPLMVAARYVAPVLDRLGVRCVSVTVRRNHVDVEGPNREFRPGRPFVPVVRVELHVLEVADAARLTRVLGVPETSREVPDYTGIAAEVVKPKEHVTWAGVVALPGAPVLLDVEVLALGPAPEVKEVA